MAPDLTHEQLDDVVGVVRDEGVTGLVIANTTVNLQLKDKYYGEFVNKAGGLSGNAPEYKHMVGEMIAYTYRVTDGEVPIIAVGGVSNGRDAANYIRMGASLVQFNAGMRGAEPLPIALLKQPRLINRMQHELLTEMNACNVDSIKDLRSQAFNLR